MFIFATTSAPNAGPGAGAKISAASQDAWAAVKTLATNPVPGVATTFDRLGAVRGLSAGIFFGAAFALALLIGVYRYLPEFARPQGVGGFLKMILVAVVPYVSLTGASIAIRMMFRGQGSFGTDGYVAGAALLPFTVVAVAMILLGSGNVEVISIVALFAVCITILMLYSALTRINKISERAATLAVPLMVMVSAWLSKVIYAAMLRGM